MDASNVTADRSSRDRRRLLEQLLIERARADQHEPSFPAHPFGTYVNPPVMRLLQAARMDKRFVRGEGCWLWDDRGTRYLDFTGAYGALPFGYNPREIWDAIAGVAAAMQPSFVQPSALDAAGELAERLIAVAPAGLERVTFASTGAEATEVAIKIARAATNRLRIVSTDNGFHGKTLGALSATGRSIYQRPFGAPAAGFDRVPYGDLESLERALGDRDVAAFIVEPIQGEGGIRVPPDGYLAAARAKCRSHGALLILDEVQTGLGRTGRLFACEHDGVAPDIMTLAKALGGGLMPIAAVLCTEACYTDEFAFKHTSTFANNTLACRVGLRTLELLTRNARSLVSHAGATGAYLKERLEQLQAAYPQLITAVRGRGFLLGLELTTDGYAFGRQCLMSSMAEQRTLALAICSYLLNVERVRLAPTVFSTAVLRVEPPLIATRELCDEFVAALDRTFDVLDRCDTAAVIGHLVDSPPRAPRPAPPRRVAPAPPPAAEKRWAFVVHPLDCRSYVDFDRDLGSFAACDLEQLIARLNECQMVETRPSLLVGSTRIVSNAGPTAYGELIAVPRTADELLALPGAVALAHIRDAVAFARERGADIVGLGAYTSVVTRSGDLLRDIGVPLTTGNGYTVVAAAESIRIAAARLGLDLARATIAVLGGAGSIGRALSMHVAGEIGRLVLIGSPAHPARSLHSLRTVAREITTSLIQEPPNGYPGGLRRAAWAAAAGDSAADAVRDRLVGERRLTITVDSDRHLLDADLIITATSSTSAVIRTDNIKPGAVVVDVSRPSNVDPAVRIGRPDVLVIEGGLIEAPGGQPLGVSFGLAPGLVYACMAETMMLALEGDVETGTVGSVIDVAAVDRFRRLAARHGFRVAQLQCGERPLDASDWSRLAGVRAAAGT
jgi:acetylornithine/succinyldiaminopimelate/putrescine aminotransferase/predicted amino acid dehydrogenase